MSSAQEAPSIFLQGREPRPAMSPAQEAPSIFLNGNNLRGKEVVGDPGKSS